MVVEIFDFFMKMGCAIGVGATLVFGGAVGGGVYYFMPKNNAIVERKDLNKDSIEDLKIEQKGKMPQFYISNSQGTYDHGRLFVQDGIGFVKLDNGSFYSFGTNGLERLSSINGPR